jgi:transposase InsO family protein
MTSPADQAAEIARLRRELDRTRTELTLAALMMATQRPGPGLIHHTDRASQYAAEA